MIISRCVPLYQQKKKEERKIEELTRRTRSRVCRVRDLWILVALVARSRGKLGSLSVSVVSPVPQKGRRILLNNSSAFDPAIISALCFCHAIWVGRDGPLFYLSPRERSTPRLNVPLSVEKKSLTPDEFNYSSLIN